MSEIIVFGKSTCRPIYPLHGVNGGPKTYNFMNDATSAFREARIPFARLHDIEYPLGSGAFVDIHCIFHDFGADPSNPASYDFFYTDKYIEAIYNAGCEPFYRLGESIDHSPYKHYVNPPEDAGKWAEICAGIVAHYNEGWADGYHYGIKYWEIWNEPENPPMWTGTKEQYFELYRVTSNLLKRRFPDIKVGGYASCGVYAAFDKNANEFYKSFITYAEDFLKYISAPDTKAPLDFFSWHIYSSDACLVEKHAEYVRKTLDAAGFSETESILNEWNYSGADMFREMRSITGGIFVADTLCKLQKPSSGVCAAMYYDAQPRQSYGGIFDKDVAKLTKAYYALKAFSELYTVGQEAETEASGNVSFAAATGNNARGLLVVNSSTDSDKIKVKFDSFSGEIKVYLLDTKHDLTETMSFHSDSFETVLEAKTAILVKAEAETE